MGVENEINAISAFNLVGVEVEAELGKKVKLWEDDCTHSLVFV